MICSFFSHHIGCGVMCAVFSLKFKRQKVKKKHLRYFNKILIPGEKHTTRSHRNKQKKKHSFSFS